MKNKYFSDGTCPNCGEEVELYPDGHQKPCSFCGMSYRKIAIVITLVIAGLGLFLVF